MNCINIIINRPTGTCCANFTHNGDEPPTNAIQGGIFVHGGYAVDCGYRRFLWWGYLEPFISLLNVLSAPKQLIQELQYDHRIDRL